MLATCGDSGELRDRGSPPGSRGWGSGLLAFIYSSVCVCSTSAALGGRGAAPLGAGFRAGGVGQRGLSPAGGRQELARSRPCPLQEAAVTGPLPAGALPVPCSRRTRCTSGSPHRAAPAGGMQRGPPVSGHGRAGAPPPQPPSTSTDQEGAVLLQEALHGAAAGAAVQPQHHGAAAGVALRLHEPAGGHRDDPVSPRTAPALPGGCPPVGPVPSPPPTYQ